MLARWGGETARFDEADIRITATVPLTRDGNSLACLGLLPSMRSRESLTVNTPVSARLLGSLDQIQDTFAGWGADDWGDTFERVAVDAIPSSGPEVRAPGVGCCFSGGLDSWYSVLENRHRITHLVTAIGFDMVPGSAIADTTLAHLRSAAEKLGLPLIVVTFDGLRTWADPVVGWGWNHGAAIAAMGHLLADTIGTLLIPSTHTADDQMPWGSHADLDHLWSSESLSIESDGLGANRVEKARRVAQSDVAMRTLRVCTTNIGGAYNCGTCEKCLRTLVNLRAVRAKPRTFARPLSLARVAWTAAGDESSRAFVRENIEAIGRRDPLLTLALHSMRAGWAYRGPLKLARDWSRRKKWDARRERLGDRAWQVG